MKEEAETPLFLISGPVLLHYTVLTSFSVLVRHLLKQFAFIEGNGQAGQS